MWVLKLRGETFYVNHVDCSVPWSTKETPDNAHTKGAIKVKSCLVTIDDENCASIKALTDQDRIRLAKEETVRVITSYGAKFRDALKNMNHGPIKLAGGGCGTTWYIADIPSKKHFTLLQLAIPDVRILMPNEDYYKLYDRRVSSDEQWLDEDDYDLEEEDFYDN